MNFEYLKILIYTIILFTIIGSELVLKTYDTCHFTTEIIEINSEKESENKETENNEVSSENFKVLTEHNNLNLSNYKYSSLWLSRINLLHQHNLEIPDPPPDFFLDFRCKILDIRFV